VRRSIGSPGAEIESAKGAGAAEGFGSIDGDEVEFEVMVNLLR
jgi:hypothetical protein